VSLKLKWSDVDFMDGLADWRSNPNLSEEDRRRISDMIRGVVDSDSDADTDEEEVGLIESGIIIPLPCKPTLPHLSMVVFRPHICTRITH
jgi:hypothetical protein